ncbi:bacterial proteasome activator family protein [Nocardioides mesophilus]|uniref:Bacterial proteasome activator n=1 Tax=Nocardioides mesophilus TaxID=433659 RepID=A0A7G9RG10_9ACTN|nr:bacterial proteasome activator family protein [Nocardioides mesophilus]QNN54535.1 bacterial proteasome activator family protein [Nocardioides mesophilus]
MSDQHPSNGPSTTDEEPRVVVLGPDGLAASAQHRAASADDADDADDDTERQLTDLVEQPAKVMRIGSMIRQLLEEVKSAPLDEASRTRLAEIHHSSIKELEAGLAPELVEELERLSLPFSSQTPSEAELRIAQAQLVGWLEGLFHGIQTAIYAQQMAARAQLEQMRRALPPGMVPSDEALQAAQARAAAGETGEEQGTRSSGMYL